MASAEARSAIQFLSALRAHLMTETARLRRARDWLWGEPGDWGALRRLIDGLGDRFSFNPRPAATLWAAHRESVLRAIRAHDAQVEEERRAAARAQRGRGP